MYTNRVFYFLILTPCSGLIRTLCNTPWVREILICLRRNKAEMFARRLNNPRGWVTNGSFHSRWVFPAGNRTKINEPGDLPKLFGRPEVGIIHPHGNIYSFDFFLIVWFFLARWHVEPSKFWNIYLFPPSWATDTIRVRCGKITVLLQPNRALSICYCTGQYSFIQRRLKDKRN